MTGPEHYIEGERLLAESRTILRNNDETCPEADRMIAEATAHFLAAQVAATAMQAAVDGSEPGMGSGEFAAWYQAAGVKPKRGGNA